MNKHPAISESREIREDDILHKFTEKSFERGRDYYDSERVERAVRRGGRLFAEVQGSEWDPYTVTARLNGRDFSASCTCPYDWGGFCKHIAATMLAFIHGGDGAFEAGEPLEDALARLDADSLRALALRMVERHPDLVDTLDDFAAARTPPSGA